jgi:hypothetical protein
MSEEILWLDGDVMESWDDLLEHLWMCGQLEGPDENGIYTFHGGKFTKGALLDLLKEVVDLNRQLYAAWALLYKIRDLPRGQDLKEAIDPILRKVGKYLENPSLYAKGAHADA